MASLKIIAMCVVAAVLYGIVHDQITARVCVEYFTIGHPPVFRTDDPTLLALGWGVIATWWAGAAIGVLLAIAARTGSRPKRAPHTLIRLILLVLALMAVGATTAGLMGRVLATRGVVWLVEPFSFLIDRSKHAAFLADAWAHLASYFFGFAGSAIVSLFIWRSR